jgi:hypothetical protein
MFGIDQSPASFEVVVRCAPVPLLVSRTVAPGMLAPVASVTLPTMSELVLAWPKAAGVNTLMNNSRNNMKKGVKAQFVMERQIFRDIKQRIVCLRISTGWLASACLFLTYVRRKRGQSDGL